MFLVLNSPNLAHLSLKKQQVHKQIKLVARFYISD